MKQSDENDTVAIPRASPLVPSMRGPLRPSSMLLSFVQRSTLTLTDMLHFKPELTPPVHSILSCSPTN